MSAAEMQLRKEKGLCYWYDEKFTFNHKCPNRQLMLLACDDSVEEPKNADTALSAEVPIQSTELEVSLNALKGGQWSLHHSI